MIQSRLVNLRDDNFILSDVFIHLHTAWKKYIIGAL